MPRRRFLAGLGGVGVVMTNGTPSLALASTQPPAGIRTTLDVGAPKSVRDLMK